MEIFYQQTIIVCYIHIKANIIKYVSEMQSSVENTLEYTRHNVYFPLYNKYISAVDSSTMFLVD